MIEISEIDEVVKKNLTSSKKSISLTFRSPRKDSFWKELNDYILKENSNIEIILQSFLDYNFDNILFLSRLTNLNRLKIISPTLKDVSVLAEIPNLKNLTLSTHTETSLEVLKSVPNLESLSLVWDKEDYESLASLSKLRRFSLSYLDDVSDEILSFLTSSLSSLTINDSPINNSEKLFRLNNLSYLSLNDIENLYNIDFILNLGKSLIYLDLSNLTEVRSLPDFSSSHIIEKISLSNMEKLINIRGIKNLKSLKEFSIMNEDKGSIAIEEFEVLTQLSDLNFASINFMENNDLTTKVNDFLVKNGIQIREATDEKYINLR